MGIDYQLIDRFLEGNTTPEETVLILAAISSNPALEEYIITEKRLAYADEQTEEYGCFIPARSLAADDGRNLCDLQCESFILKEYGIDVADEDLAVESRKNYWLRDQGMPLFNMGKILEIKGFLVNRIYNATLDILENQLKEHSVIAVVNGDALLGRVQDILSQDFSLESNPNHAVVVLEVRKESGRILLFNPSDDNTEKLYDLEAFINAWEDSKQYMVTVRRKKSPDEYIPQPIDTSGVTLNAELEDLIEMICENVHDEWAHEKREREARKGLTLKYAPLTKEGKERRPRHGTRVSYNHFYLPYAMLSEEDKKPDRVMVLSTLKLLKRLGYRLININSMYRCPDCGEVIEPSNNFCPSCGRALGWQDFKDL